MSSRFAFRPMRLTDIAQVHALECAIYPNPWALTSFRFEVENNRTSQPWVAEELDNASSPKVIGFLIAWHIVDELHIANLAVHPHFRRQGLARRMLHDALQRGRAQGLVRAALEVRVGNAAAQRLYRSFGFAPIGERPRYYTDNREDAIIMGLEDLAAQSTAEPQS